MSLSLHPLLSSSLLSSHHHSIYFLPHNSTGFIFSPMPFFAMIGIFSLCTIRLAYILADCFRLSFFFCRSADPQVNFLLPTFYLLVYYCRLTSRRGKAVVLCYHCLFICLLYHCVAGIFYLLFKHSFILFPILHKIVQTF